MTYIYAIGLEIRGRPVIKVGVAANVKTRLSDLQIGCPLQLEILGLWKFTEGAATTEALFHLSHVKFNRHGEWFNVSIDTVRRFMERDISMDMSVYGIQGCRGVEVEPPIAPRVQCCLMRMNHKMRWNHKAHLQGLADKKEEERKAQFKRPKKHSALIKSILLANSVKVEPELANP